MADITIDDAAYNTSYYTNNRGGPFGTGPLISYVIYVDSSFNLAYIKTTDGGATWAKNVLVTGTILKYDCWADWQTAGDAGTKIHISCIDADTDEVIYVYLDTSNDSEGTDTIEACQGTGAIQVSLFRTDNGISITKTRGGNLAVAFYYKDTGAAFFYEFYTSPDGDTWTNKDDPWEATADHILLFPGNEADNQDVLATFWDWSADEISLKTYDDSGDSWSAGTLISASMAEDTNYRYLQMDGAIFLDTGYLFFIAWNLYDNVNADLMCWIVNGEGSIIAKTNILTDSAESFLVSVFINQGNNDIYVAYARGTQAEVAVKVFYKKSTDGGTTWSGETAMQADAEDNERWISCGAVKTTWGYGGKFQPVWFNDDLNDIFCNVDNSVSIDAVFGIWPSMAVVIDMAVQDLVKGTLSIDTRIEERSTAYFVIYDEAGVLTFSRGQPVEIYTPDANLVFSGFVWDPEESPVAPAGGLFHKISCVDNHYSADKRLVAVSYEDKTCGFIVDDIYDNYLADEGITIGNIELGVTILESRFPYVSVTDAFDKLAEASGFTWWIDENKDLYFQARATTTAPWAIVGDMTDIKLKGSMRMSGGNPQYRNRQYIRGGRDVTAPQTETFTADGDMVAFTVGYPINAEPVVKEDGGAAETMGIKGIDEAVAYYWSKGDPVVVAAAAPANGVVVTIEYIGQYDILVLATNEDEIAAQAAIEGVGTGFVDDIDDEVKLDDKEAAFDAAEAKLDKYGVTGKRLRFTTRRSGLTVGQLLTVTYVPFDLTAEELLIEAVTLNGRRDETEYVVSAIQGPVTGSWAKFFKGLADMKTEIMERLNVGSDQILIILAKLKGNVEVSGTLSYTAFACEVVDVAVVEVSKVC